MASSLRSQSLLPPWKSKAVDDSTSSDRISVSRDALRADLAEMELRLRTYFDLQLKGKADTSQVNMNTGQIQEMRRGEFTPALKRSIEELVADTVGALAERGWTSKQRILGVVAVCVSVCSLALAIYVSLNSAINGQQVPTPTTVRK